MYIASDFSRHPGEVAAMKTPVACVATPSTNNPTPSFEGKPLFGIGVEVSLTRNGRPDLQPKYIQHNEPVELTGFLNGVASHPQSGENDNDEMKSLATAFQTECFVHSVVRLFALTLGFGFF